MSTFLILAALGCALCLAATLADMRGAIRMARGENRSAQRGPRATEITADSSK